MSESTTALGELTRDELEAHIRDLEGELDAMGEEMRQMETDMAFIKKSLITLTDADLGEEMGVMELPQFAEQTRGSIEDLQSATKSHGETLATIADVESDKSSEGEKIGAIVAYADQARSGTKALVTPKEIAGATGCSKRYAYDLIDKIGGLDDDASEFDEGPYPWAAVRKATTVPTANGSEKKAKALKIDFDRVQRDSGALNQFNNGTGGNGGE